MTPPVGFLVALIAGFVVRGPRRAMAAVVPPWLAVLAVQTWFLGSGRGVNPASTVRDPSYWAVQAIFFAFALAIAAGLSDWRSYRTYRARRHRRHSPPRLRPAPARA